MVPRKERSLKAPALSSLKALVGTGRLRGFSRENFLPSPSSSNPIRSGKTSRSGFHEAAIPSVRLLTRCQKHREHRLTQSTYPRKYILYRLLFPESGSQRIWKKNIESVLVQDKLMFSTFDFERAAIYKQSFSHINKKLKPWKNNKWKCFYQPQQNKRKTQTENQNKTRSFSWLLSDFVFVHLWLTYF